MLGNGQFVGLVVVTIHVGDRKLDFVNGGILRHDLSQTSKIGMLTGSDVLAKADKCHDLLGRTGVATLADLQMQSSAPGKLTPA
jgi:hypothetical protein